MLQVPEKKPRAERRPTRRMMLTDRDLRSKKLERAEKGDRIVIYDKIVTELAISVTDKGTKTWILYTRYKRPDGSWQPAKLALGGYPELSLSEVREKAKKWLELIEKGLDPREVEKQAAEAEKKRRGNTFGALAEDFIRDHLEGQRKAKAVEREIRQELIAHWKDKPVTDITPDDVKALVKAIKKRGAFYVAHTVLGEARSIFSFGIDQGGYGLTHSPVAGIKPKKLIGAKKSRQRVLDDDELRAYWKAAKTLGPPWDAFYQLLLLTGQRKSEVAGIRRSELKGGLWTIPEERFKSGHVHLVPLPLAARAILRRQPTFKGEHFLTTTAGRKPINGFSKAKAALDKAMAKELGRAIQPWVQHDVRRTVRTRLSELGVRYEVAELIIGHTLKGLHAVYDQHKFLDERRAALELWRRRLRQIVRTDSESRRLKP